MAEPLLLPKPEAKAEPAYPQTNVAVNASGVQITTLLAAGIAFTTVLNEETMNQVCALWVQTRKDIAEQLRLIEHVQRSKNN